MERFRHVVQLRVTRQDLEALHRMADARQLSIEDMIRAELRLPSYDSTTTSALAQTRRLVPVGTPHRA